MISTTVIVASLLQMADAVHQCPMYGVGGLGYPYSGTYCGSESPFHYYTCCEHNFYECCFNLEPWVMYVNSDLYPYGPLTSADYLSHWMTPCNASPQQHQAVILSFNDNCGNVNCDVNCNNDCCCCDDGIDYCNMDLNGYPGMVGGAIPSYLPNSAGLLMYPHYNQPYSTLNTLGIPYSPYINRLLPFGGYQQPFTPLGAYSGLSYLPNIPSYLNQAQLVPSQHSQPPILPKTQYFSPQYYDLYRQYIQVLRDQQIRHLQKMHRCKRKCKGEALHGVDVPTQMDPPINDESTSHFIIYFSVALVILVVVGILMCLGCCGFCIWTVRPSD